MRRSLLGLLDEVEKRSSTAGEPKQEAIQGRAVGDVRSSSFLNGVLIGVFITFFAVMLAFVSAGFGHGHYRAARMLFPYTMLIAGLTDGAISPPLVVLALGQFPFYCASIGVWGRKLPSAITTLILCLIHALAATLCFSGLIPRFS
jgi:hypothetical protein